MSTRLTGKSIVFRIEDIDYQCDAGRVELTNDTEDNENDFVTFCDTSSASPKWTLEVEAIQSFDDTSLWMFLWNNAGEEAVFTFAPAGNAVPSTTQPHFTGTINVGSPPSIGGTANETFTFEKSFEVLGDVAMETDA